MQPILLLLASLPALQAPLPRAPGVPPRERPGAQGEERRDQERPRAGEGAGELARPAGEARGWLGVSLEHKEVRGGERGLEILEVQRGSPADRAGLRRGDVLHSLDGQRVQDHDSLARVLARQEPGDVVEVAVRRTLSVELQTAPRGPRRPDLPRDPDAPQETPRMGVTIDPAGRELSVSAAEPGWGAERAGIRPGDVVLLVDGRRVASVDQVIEQLGGKQPGASVEVTILRRERVRMGSAAEAGAVRPGVPGRQAEPRAVEPRGEAREARAAREGEVELREEIRRLSEELRSLREEMRELRRELQRSRER